MVSILWSKRKGILSVPPFRMISLLSCPHQHINTSRKARNPEMLCVIFSHGPMYRLPPVYSVSASHSQSLPFTPCTCPCHGFATPPSPRTTRTTQPGTSWAWVATAQSIVALTCMRPFQSCVNPVGLVRDAPCGVGKITLRFQKCAFCPIRHKSHQRKVGGILSSPQQRSCTAWGS